MQGIVCLKRKVSLSASLVEGVVLIHQGMHMEDRRNITVRKSSVDVKKEELRRDFEWKYSTEWIW